MAKNLTISKGNRGTQIFLDGHEIEHVMSYTLREDAATGRATLDISVHIQENLEVKVE